ncbi:MAG: hypothetical protein AAFQ22_05995 [Pseudomonadota bacterium]
METFTKQLGDWELIAVPGRGGALAACRHKGSPILREAMDIAEGDGSVINAAAYPMVPFCGRILDARLVFEGAEYLLDRNFAPEPHAIHGTGWQSHWSIDIAEDRLSMALMDDSLRWPWAFMAEQSFSLDGEALQLKMKLINIGERRMPAGLGWHPFFSGDAEHIQAGVEDAPAGPDVSDAGQYWASDYACAELGKGVFTDRLRVDSAFFWPGRSAEMLFRNSRTVTLSGGDTAHALTVYRPPNANFVAVEPQTHVPGAHSHPYPETLGLRALAPGETLHLSATLSVS